jgi:hypothetical protein
MAFLREANRTREYKFSFTIRLVFASAPLYTCFKPNRRSFPETGPERSRAEAEERDHYEIQPRPAELGGGYRLRLLAGDQETGDFIEMGGGVFPIEEGVDEKDAQAEARQTGEDWIAASPEEEFAASDEHGSTE